MGVCLHTLANGRLSLFFFYFNWHQEDLWDLGIPNTSQESWVGLKGASALWNLDSDVKSGKGQRKVQVSEWDIGAVGENGEGETSMHPCPDL